VIPEDRFAVADVVVGLLHAIDALDWKGVRAALADQVDVDYTSLFGGEASSQPADVLIGGWRDLLPGFAATQHLLGPIAARREGNGVIAETHVRAYHHLASPDAQTWMVAGHYTFRLVGEPDWKIAGITLATYHQDGSQRATDLARERARTSASRGR
jgi:hypothetical protein